LNCSRHRGGIEVLSHAKLSYETTQISGDFIKFSECHDPLR